MSKTCLYLAGPMRGYAEFNFPAFHEAAAKLRAAGYEVWSPAENDLEVGFDPTGMTGFESLEERDFDLRDALATDLDTICRWSDGVALLPGWRGSAGARAEAATAFALGLESFPVEVWLAGAGAA